MKNPKQKNPKKIQNQELLKKAKLDDCEEILDEDHNNFVENKEIIYDFEEIQNNNTSLENSDILEEKKTKKPNDYTNLEKIDILRIDLLIFNILKRKSIEKTIEYVDINKFITLEDLFPLKCNKKWVVKRILFNIEQGYIKWHRISEDEQDLQSNINRIVSMCRSRKLKTDWIIYEENWKKKINYDKYYETFLELKLTPQWLVRSDQINLEIKTEQKNQSRIHKNIRIIQWYTNNFVNNYKTSVWLFLTLCLALWLMFLINNPNNIWNQNFMWSILIPQKHSLQIDENDYYYKTLIDTISQNSWFNYILENINDPKTDIVKSNQTNNTKTFTIKLNNWQKINITIINENWMFRAINYEKYLK